MADNQGENLKDFLETFKKPGEKKKTMEEVAVDLDIAKATLYNHFKKPELDLNFIRLLHEKGYPFGLDKSSIFRDREPEYKTPKGDIVYVPLVAYGGFLHGYASKVFMGGLERFSMPGIRGEHYAFEVQGSSMAPYAVAGDVVISRKEERLEWMIRGRAYVLQTIDGIIIKIFEKIEEGKAYFRSADKDSSHPTIPLQDIKGVYQVVKVLKDFTVN